MVTAYYDRSEANSMQENKLGVMPIKKLIWNMSLPIMASMLVQALYNIVDSMFVSWLDQDALTAVSLAFSAQQLMIGLSTGTAVGVNALMGRALGAKDQKRADTVAVNGVFLALVGAVLIAVLGLSCSNALFSFQTDDPNIIRYGNEYLTVVAGCSFTLFGQVIFERLLQGTGRSVYSMYTQGLGAIINIILDPIFIFTLGMGVRGAAIATVIGQLCAMCLAYYFNRTKNPDITLRFRGFRPDLSVIGGIYAIGLPSAVMMVVASVMTFAFNKILIVYHAFHETAATAFGVYFKLNSFIFMPVFGMNNGIVPILSFNYGARNKARMLETVKRSVAYACIILGCGTLIFHLVPRTLLSIFKAGEDLMAVGVPCLRIISVSFPIAGACISLITVFQALGHSLSSLLISFVRQLIVLVPAAYVLARYGAAVGNSNLVWWSFPAAEVVALVITLLLYRRIYRTVIAPLPEAGRP